MERLALPLQILTFLLFILASGVAATRNSPDFIRSSCESTLYPVLCENCLSSYSTTIRHNSRRQLARAALTVTLKRSLSASTFVTRLSSGVESTDSGKPPSAIWDCVENLRDSVDRLNRSILEMGRMGRAGTARYAYHLSNVQTWASAALTDQNTCLDSLFAGSSTEMDANNVTATVREKIATVVQMTSNALALVNLIGAKQ